MSSTARRRSRAENPDAFPPLKSGARIGIESNASEGKGKGKLSEIIEQNGADDMYTVDDEDMQSLPSSEDDESLHCSICLSIIDNRTIAQPCGHGELMIIAIKLKIDLFSNHFRAQTHTVSSAFLHGLSNLDVALCALSRSRYWYTISVVTRISKGQEFYFAYMRLKF